ncbi:thiamine phosphate synthase [Longispora sp. K20-0274]|uniref:thiamine phosphate synthase n=1 Tax=Longispora sp. K20-0274 TaxID=3088255 RepID=UPI00399BC1AE
MLGRLHVLTDARPGRDAVAVARAALAAGAPLFQVRVEDGVHDRDFLDFAAEIRALCRVYGATCLINDRVDIALAVQADGVHLGAFDLPVSVARRLLGSSAIIGATSRDAAGARAALVDGADYVGVGPCYPTSTKDGLPDPIGPAGLEAAAHVGLPAIAIGGVTLERVPELLEAGAYGVAVVGAVNSADEPGVATKALLKALS